jgi:hypothetical protein
MPTLQNPAYRALAHDVLPRWLGPVLLAVAVTAAGTPSTRVQADDSVLTWIVKSISDDDGRVIQASTLQVPQEGAALMTGQKISTKAGQHMVLVNGRDLVEVDPNTTITIGDDDARTLDANVDVVSGAIHVEVGKRAPGQTFSVGAPYLVATVKGTKFNVTSSSEASTVDVTEGVVAVSSIASQEVVDVTPGNTATVSRNSTGRPALAPTPASGTTGLDTDTDSASANTGGGSDSGGTSGGGGGSDSGGSSGGGGGSDSGGSSGGSGSGGGSGGSGSGGGLGGAVGGAAGAVGGAVGGAADAAGGAVSDTADAVGGAVGGSLGDTVSGAGEAVGGAVSGVGGAVGGAVGGVGGALGGALGGLGGNK